MLKYKKVSIYAGFRELVCLFSFPAILNFISSTFVQGS